MLRGMSTPESLRLFQIKLTAVESHHLVEAGDSILFDHRAVILEDIERVVAMGHEKGARQIERVADCAQRETIGGSKVAAVRILVGRKLHFPGLIVAERIGSEDLG